MYWGKGMKFVGDLRILVEKKLNILKDYLEYFGKIEVFWLNFLLKEWMVGVVFLIGFFVLMIVYQLFLEWMVDLIDIGYILLLDWYFFFLYQLLKYEYVVGSFIVVGVMIMLGFVFGVLFLVLFFDRGIERRLWKCFVVVGMMFLVIFVVVFLMWQLVVIYDWVKVEEQGKIIKEVDIDINVEGYKVFKEQGCIFCYGDNF